jgi:hypothetical protein
MPAWLLSVKTFFGILRREPRACIYLVLSILMLTGGIVLRVWPFSRFAKKSLGYGIVIPLLAALSMLIVWLGIRLWLAMRPKERIQTIFERTSLSLLVAVTIGVWASMGPPTKSIFFGGQFIRCATTAIVFIVMQLFWIWNWNTRIRDRVIQLWKTKEIQSWHDVVGFCFLAVCVTESLTHMTPALKITPAALVVNVAMLTSMTLVLWAIFNRSLVALSVVLCGYLGIAMCNAFKLRYLYSALQIGDYEYLSELSVFTEYFTTARIVGLGILAAFALLLWSWSWIHSTVRMELRWRLRMFVTSCVLVSTAILIPWIPGSVPVLQAMGICEHVSHSADSIRRNGILYELTMQIPRSYVPEPNGYKQSEIERVATKHTLVAEEGSRPDEQPVRIVVFLFESLMDPRDFGRPLQREVLPHLSQLRETSLHGYSITARPIGGSAESEFELLTGMSCGFLPNESCAYKHFVKRSLPSLVSLLKSNSFATTAIQVVPAGFYNYEQVYQHLGHDRFQSIEKLHDPQIDTRSRLISDATIVNEILLSQDSPKSFVVAFNNASHSPYHAHTLGDAPRFLADPATPASDEIEVYLQAISRTDRELGRLVSELKKQNERVVLLVVGDHHPPLTPSSGAFDTKRYKDTSPDGELFRRRVPFIIWKNFDSSPVGEPDTSSTAKETIVSMNFLSLLLLKEANIEPQGLMAWNTKLMEQCPVVSRNIFYTAGQARSWEQLSPDLQHTIREYELLQYDQLLGESYTARIWQANRPQENVATRHSDPSASVNDPKVMPATAHDDSQQRR